MMTLDTALSNMISYTLTGGAAIDPATATDTDYICLAPINTTVCDWPCKHTRYSNDSETVCLSHDDVDLVIVTRQDTYNKWVVATRLCQIIPPVNKHARKDIFRAVVLGIAPAQDHYSVQHPLVDDAIS